MKIQWKKTNVFEKHAPTDQNECSLELCVCQGKQKFSTCKFFLTVPFIGVHSGFNLLV